MIIIDGQREQEDTFLVGRLRWADGAESTATIRHAPLGELGLGDAMMRARHSAAISAATLSIFLAIPAPAQTIATADGEQTGLRIDITELKRTSGDTVTLKFTLANDSGEKVKLHDLLEAYDVRTVHLIDAAGKKKYLTITDASGNCVCTADLGNDYLESGKVRNFWARFPAPPREVKEVSVIFPHFIPTDAAISE